MSNTREQTPGSLLQDRAQDSPTTTSCLRGEQGRKCYLRGLGQLPGMATASFHWSALDTE